MPLILQTQTAPLEPPNKVTVAMPLDLREAGLVVCTGFQGTGKSYQTLHDVQRYLRMHPNRKSLFFDVNKEYGIDGCAKHGLNMLIKTLGPTAADIQRFTAHSIIEPRRVLAQDPKTGEDMNTEQMTETLATIMTNFRHGILLIEDMNTYITDVRYIQRIESIIVRLRHRELDTIVHFQTLSALDTKMWQNVRYIRMHWQSDPVDRYEKRISNFKLVKIAQLLVDYMHDDRGDERFFVWIHMLKNKITGKFSKADFKLAVYRYLLLEGSELRDAEKLVGNIPNQREAAFNRCYQKAVRLYGNSV